ncbi:MULTISPECIES: CPBP family intramembrane glutamic endopeptidase [unclassified Frankia]|nr:MULTISPECIES: CPBP family intramembrane glutamic endopeptidase [unclassified Frankia]OHV52391.1 hypothetical protein CgIS1_17115 [Frankia sp. CgIS1]
MTGSGRVPGRRLPRYEARPVLVACVVFAILGTLRIAGAFDEWLKVFSIVLTPFALFVVPRRMWSDVGVQAISSPRQLARGIGVVTAGYLLTLVACLTLLGRGEDNWAALLPGLFREMFPGSPALAYISLFLCMGLLVPIAEEVFYRGVLLHAASRRMGLWRSVVTVSAGWALVHLGDYGLNPFNPLVLAGMIPSVFVMGLALGYCRMVTGSVVGTTIAQGVANVLFTIWAISL